MTWSLDFHSSQSLFKQILFLNHPRSDSTLLNQKMSVLALSNSLPTLPPSSPSPSETPKPLSPLLSNFTTTIHNNSISWTKKTIITALSGALSFGLVFSPPCSVALESPTIRSPPPPPPPSSEYCREDEQVLKAESGPELVTNAGIVEEAWEIVNDSFLGTGRHRWSPQTWQVKQFYTVYTVLLLYFELTYIDGF